LKRLLVNWDCCHFDIVWQKLKWIASAAEWCVVAVKQSPCKIWFFHIIVWEDSSLPWYGIVLLGEGSSIFWRTTFVSFPGSCSLFLLVCVTLKTNALCLSDCWQLFT
jgi:hypothetical protein